MIAKGTEFLSGVLTYSKIRFASFFILFSSLITLCFVCAQKIKSTEIVANGDLQQSIEIQDSTVSQPIIINDINDNQQIMAEEFKEVKSDIGTMSQTLDTIRVTMMTDKKFKLKSLIYECLNAGFATPEQNEVIKFIEQILNK